MVLVYGLGVSGLACVEFLLAKKIPVCVYDDDKNRIAELLDKKIVSCQVIENITASIKDIDEIILSPTVRLNAKLQKEAFRYNIKVWGEFEFASQFCTAPIYAVTGTNGKTTTVTFLQQILSFCGKKTFLVGNVGTPFSEVVANVKPSDVVVAELSNFQLEHSSNLKLQSAGLVSIAPDHLDKYDSFDDYFSAKQNILYCVSDKVFLNYDDSLVRSLAKKCKNFEFFSTDSMLKNGICCFDGEVYSVKNGHKSKLFRLDNFSIQGKHNLSNLLCAVSLALNIGLKASEIEKSLTKLTLPRHRLEFVRNVDGVDYFNDSKATNIHAVISALNNFKNRKVTLLLGGSEKNEDWSSLVLPFCVKNVIAFGASGKKIMKALRKQTDVTLCESLFDAVYEAKEKASDVVLLSPGCASFDEFFSYSERGEYFCELVNGF